ncbi:MAG: NADH-quinone oxidoreductase subunit D [Candidatus Sedimenticola endophacoides]|uniref:NADH-quinone oxidoreductase subunit D n=1 Tax=Candidatus Sedimenticola endophacoides TaxID=2548426 RepID=A0A6N4DVL6_9GAMM|nr:MAG: NADH-quinone oxidoreductase subunit D [Candidatus Sedimenticola endophacoides]PUE00938.1 MAG: NADH-quinone oxidoreductase subunit D [Candidatus Sedimenticola endophacoides]PUE03551.1 MAG: NADH-quinone oxidoreductase subunit D [Candidatus Sedimenticola endophacoides]
MAYQPDRSQYPQPRPDGSLDIDLRSGKYLKLWQGPQHPGITGNMSLELTVCGDEVVAGRTHVGYLHRGFEKLMERRTFIQCFPIVCRICVPEPDFNEYCYAAAVEELAGIEVPERAQWIRTLILEMGRVNSYLMYLGGQAGAFGQAVIGQWTTYARDLMLDRFEELTGARIYHMFILPGGVRDDLPEGFGRRMEQTLREIEEILEEVREVMFDNAVLKRRAIGLGHIDPALLDAYGVTGPTARAAGVAKDVRRDHPYLVYPRLAFEPVVAQASDVHARADVRRRDLLLSIDLIRQILAGMPGSGAVMTALPNVLHWKIPRGETYIRGECSRGEYGYYLVSDGSGYPRRVNVRGPSYTHAVALLERLIVNVNIADVAALMVSLHTYPPEIER